MDTSEAESITEEDLVTFAAAAKHRIVLAIPSLTAHLGSALAEANQRLPGRVLAIIDPDERVYRVGYGAFSEIQEAFGKGLPLLSRPGLRLGCGLIDGIAFFLTMPPQLVEAPPDPETNSVNAAFVEPQIVLSFLRGIANGPELDAVLAPLAELPTQAQEDPLVRVAKSQEANEETPHAIPISPEVVQIIKCSLDIAPPMDFQVHRQSMVYTSLLLYVVVELSACRMDNREISVGKTLLPLLGEKIGIDGRRTFQLRFDGDPVGLALIQARTEFLRTRIARNLGKPFGTVLLRQDLQMFEEERWAIEAMINTEHPKAIKAFEEGLEPQLQDIEHICMEQCLYTLNDDEILQVLRPTTKDHLEQDLWVSLQRSHPTRSDLVQALKRRIGLALWNNVRQMICQLERPRLEVTIREFTLQQMNERDFVCRLRKAFRDKEDLVPFLEDKAVIGRRAKA